MRKVRLVDVAEHAGVSKSTVSQYLNGRFDYMSEATREKIAASVKALNYEPNPIARSLKTNKTKTIGVVVRDVTGFDTSRAIRGIDDFCKTSEYNVLVYNTDHDVSIEAKSLNALAQLRIDGLIIASSGQNSDLIKAQAERGLPIVEFQLEHDDDQKNIVVSDYRKASFEATDYLIKLGHTRIGFVTQAFINVKSRHERYLGFTDAILANGLSLDDQPILNWDRDTGFEIPLLEVLREENPPTALFSQHLAITTVLLNELNDADICIPDDVSLLGFDDMPMADFLKVPITVIKQDPHKTGIEAAKLLLQQITDSHLPAERITVPCSLVIRQSCRAIK